MGKYKTMKLYQVNDLGWQGCLKIDIWNKPFFFKKKGCLFFGFKEIYSGREIMVHGLVPKNINKKGGVAILQYVQDEISIHQTAERWDIDECSYEEQS